MKLGDVASVVVLCSGLGVAAWLFSHRQQAADLASLVSEPAVTDVTRTPGPPSPPIDNRPTAALPGVKTADPVLRDQTRPAPPNRTPEAARELPRDTSMRARRAGAASTSPAATSASTVVLANATREFRNGRSLFDSGDYAAASVAFARVVAMVEHEKNLGPDLQQVASEFAAISRERAAKQATLVFTQSDTDVVPPVISSGRLPARPSPDTPAARLDVLELTIDAGGAVEKARLETSRNHYDNRWWVSAAKTWRFQPATRNGRPVRYIVRLPITDGGPR